MVSRNCQTLVTTALVFGALSFPLSARAANMDFGQVVIFGNSVSDTGNVFSISGGAFPPSPLYYEGRFSDGRVWTDYLSQDLDLNLVNFYSSETKDKSSSINFAIGGATSGTTALGGPMFPGVAAQVEDFVELLDGTPVNSDALVILWSGENDYVEAFNQGTVIDPTVSIGRISDSLQTLADLGTKTVLVPNLPNFGDMPVGQILGTPEQANMITAEHNRLLSLELESLSTLFPETHFMLFDANSVVKEIFNNPTDFGFNENPLENTCLEPNSFPNIDPNVVRCDDPSKYIYFDNQHFTSEVHLFIKDAAITTLEAELESSTLAATPVPESRNNIGLIALGMGLFFRLSQRKS